ncbi:MAG: RNA 2',3'-cyclic phosphodiesterase [Sphingomonadaceae bacterium]
MSHRLFVAIRPPAAVRAALVGLMGGVADARWQTDAQLHATLAFLGEVDRHRANAITEQLAHVRFAPFPVQLDGFGTFDNARGRITSLWTGLSPREKLAALAARISTVLLPVGVPLPTRRFVPHVTIARFPARGAAPASLSRFLAGRTPPPIAWEVERFSLLESHLGGEGAHYAEIACYPEAVTESSADRRRW